MPPLRIGLTPICATPDNQVKINIRRASKYPRVEWGVMKYPVCAVVGGGPSVMEHLDELRAWPGEVFAINDTGKFLSENGIPSIVFSADGTKVPFRLGGLEIGGLFATRVHRCQFAQLKGKPIRVFDMLEDNPRGGVEGGATTVCRAPHLLLRMGYAGITFFGFDGSFLGDVTHVSGKSDSAHDNMIIVRAGGVEYITHAGFLLQHEWMINALNRHPKFLYNASGGLFKAMFENQDTWEVVAIAEDLKEKYEKNGAMCWTKEYTPKNLWFPVNA